MNFKIGFILLVSGIISGCSMIPSFWDDNEAYGVAKVRHSVDAINCSGNYLPQVNALVSDIRFLQLYTESKGSDDLGEMVEPMMETAKGLANKDENVVFCNIKKKLLVEQSATIADATMERF